MKPFKKAEIISLVVIFTILVAASIPNFILSLRRARDQVRRNDMGSLQEALQEYSDEFGALLPPASSDGRIVDCLKQGDKPVQGKDGKLIINPIPCDWGKDSFKNLFTERVYITILPKDPDYQKGASYLYFSEGNRFQIYASMEGLDEAEVDPKIIARNLKCGNRICNIGRSYNVPTDISIEDYNKLLLKQNVKK